MSKTAQKQYMKTHQEFVIHKPDGTKVPELDYRLHMVYNVKGGNPRMWWVNRKNHENMFPKIKGDMIPVMTEGE